MQVLIIYILLLMFSVYRIYSGWRIVQSKTFTYKRQVDPLIFLSKVEAVTATGKAAKFMGYESIAVGVWLLFLLFVDLVFAGIVLEYLVFIVLFSTALFDALAHMRVDAMVRA